MASPQHTPTSLEHTRTDPVVADFEVTDWRQADEGGRQRAFVTKTFSGTGTDELAGLPGQITYSHDESGARVQLILSS